MNELVPDRHEGALSSLVRKSKLIKSRSIRDFFSSVDSIKEADTSFLDDRESVAIKRLAASRYLDFPHVLRGNYVSSKLPYNAPIEDFDLSLFFENPEIEKLFLYLQPWEMQGAINIDKSLLKNCFWQVLEYSDFKVNIYDSTVSKSCIILNEEENNRINYSFIM